MTNFRINLNPRGGWLVIEQDKTIESIQIFFNDAEFLKAAGAENTGNAIDLFKMTAKRKNLTAIIFDYHQFTKWDLRYWDNHPKVLLKAEELGWIKRI